MITESQLAHWTGPSSDTEQQKQERTERMIREALRARPSLADLSPPVYAKGSYANNTNVRSDSDVDIVVECTKCFYYDRPRESGASEIAPYDGEWTPAYLRSEIHEALKAKFPGAVTLGSTAISVDSTTSRVDADVVPSFTYRDYAANGTYREGTRVFRSDGTSVDNYPKLQLSNGRAKNNRTRYAYKKVVRILKRLNLKLSADGKIDAIPSYLVECLVYNCEDSSFTRYSTWTAMVQACLAQIFNYTRLPEPGDQDERWLEGNEVKFLFHPSQKWTRDQAHAFASAAWDVMGFE